MWERLNWNDEFIWGEDWGSEIFWSDEVEVEGEGEDEDEDEIRSDQIISDLM
jgi:hypothetical protein